MTPGFAGRSAGAARFRRAPRHRKRPAHGRCAPMPPPAAAARPCGPRALRARSVREDGEERLRQPGHLRHLVTEARPGRSDPSCGGAGWEDSGLKPGRPSPGWLARISGDAFGPGSPLQSPLAGAPGNFRCDPYRLRSLALPARSACPGKAGTQKRRRTWPLMSYLSLREFQSWQIRVCPRQGTAATGLLAT